MNNSVNLILLDNPIKSFIEDYKYKTISNSICIYYTYFGYDNMTDFVNDFKILNNIYDIKVINKKMPDKLKMTITWVQKLYILQAVEDVYVNVHSVIYKVYGLSLDIEVARVLQKK